MPGLSKVIVLDPDARAGRQVQLGFEREGVPTAVIPAHGDALELPSEGPGLLVVGGVDGHGLELVRRARSALTERRLDAPIVFSGRGVARDAATAAGADEVMLAPAYLRDVVTVGRLLRGLPASQRGRLVGSLVEITGVYTLVRALAALGRSATLTLVRGLRRGEIRFYHGEVTSAQVGMIHGQAALHQLLLWTDARFDFHPQDVVRRHQIPLSHDELFADAERFLEGVRDSSGGLSPAIVLEPNAPRVQALGKQIPSEVLGVLRMFDGHRLLADVLEDSAYRVFETLRVAQRAVEVGLLRVVEQQPRRPTWRAILAIEEWLVGNEVREPVVDSGPIATSAATRGVRATDKSRKRRKKKKRVNTTLGVAAAPATPEIDWGALVPRIAGAEVGPLAGVVPATHVSGEFVAAPAQPIAVISRAGDPVPKVVLDDGASEARAVAIPRTIPAPRDAGQVNAQLPEEVSARLPRVELGAAAEHPHMDEIPLAVTKPERLAARSPMSAMAGMTVAERAGATVIVHDVVTVETSGATTARITATPMASVVVHHSGPDTSGATTAKIVVPVVTVRVASTAGACTRPAALPNGSAVQSTDEPEATQPAPAPATLAEPAAVAVDPVATASEPTAKISGPTAKIAEPPTAIAEPPTAIAEPATASEPTAKISGPIAKIAEPTASIAEPIATASEPTAKISGLTSTTKSAGLIRPAQPPEPLPADSSDPTTPFGAPQSDSAPSPITDEPSDGVIRQRIITAETAPVRRRRLPSDPPPEDDRPEDATGEIMSPGVPTTRDPRNSEPTILVSDLAAVHSVAGELADDHATARRLGDAASAALAAPVVEARNDAVAFSELEEAFFRDGHARATVAPPTSETETFDDLDEGYRPVGFWDRLRGKVPPRPAKPKK